MPTVNNRRYRAKDSKKGFRDLIATIKDAMKRRKVAFVTK